MRDLGETKARWQETVKHSSSFVDLQRSVKFSGTSSPCVTGCRSVCWKAFLLFQGATSSGSSHVLVEARKSYESLREEHLKYIKHPEKLNELSVDPLADDPESPWDAVRRDEVVRAEILQDVQRLPDEPFYHEDRIQTMILDILFIYCKTNPTAGGYRQGMHELLAPLLFVVNRDAVDREAAASDPELDATMVEMLDSNFIEHDAYILFAKVMQRAGSFYELGDPNGAAADQSAIVEKSKYIHEVILMKIDPELATHLKSIEVLPQIFLIRWVRLLFGREFPFDQLLVLWDAIFAFDPTLDLIDLMCVAMLLRVRWTLLEADYSVALQLLLRYPSPEAPHGPHTFVDDAVYLKDHLNPAGGATLILKYTGRALAHEPSPPQATTARRASRPSAPGSLGLPLRQRTLGAKSPLMAPAKFLQTPGGVEALFQGAAKNVIQRGEKLGINQAVRDAVGEIRRNVQGLQEARTPGAKSSSSRDPFADSDHALANAFSIAQLERRERQLAAMLGETMNSLRELASTKLEGGDREKYIEAIEVAAAKIQFVKVHLEDSSLSLPAAEEEMPPINSLAISSPEDARRAPTIALDTTPVVMTSSAVETVRSTLSSPDDMVQDGPLSPPSPVPPVRRKSTVLSVLPDIPAAIHEHDEHDEHDEHEHEHGVADAIADADRMDTDTIPFPEFQSQPQPEEINPLPIVELHDPEPIPELIEDPLVPSSSSFGNITAIAAIAAAAAPKRPPPLPTRSTLAQSSFSWMLEPDTIVPLHSPSMRSPTSAFSADHYQTATPGGGGGGGAGAGGGGHHKKGPSSSGRRNTKNAFLFGEVVPSDGEEERKLSGGEIFGLQPMGK